MLHIAVVGGDPAELAELADLIREELCDCGQPAPVMDMFSGGAAFLAGWRPGAYDAVVLDIHAGRVNGIETARRIRAAGSRVPLAFCSHSNGFAAESYEVEARYYLRKPLTRTGVSAMLRRLLPNETERRRTVELPGRRRVPLRSILFTAYYNHVVTVYLADGAGDASASQMRVRTTQAEIERRLLPHEEFVAPARGIVVNLFAVAKMSPEDFILRSGHIIRIARRRSKEMREAYDRFREELAQRGTTEW